MAAAVDIIAYPFTSKVTYDENDLPIYDRAVDAEILRNIQRQYFTNGVFANPASSFKVSPTGGGMSVQVAPGSCNINGTTGYKTTSTTIELEKAGATDVRYGIVLRLDDSLDVRAVQIDVIRGTGSALPTYTRTDTIHELIIAHVRARAGATSIELADIEDTRLNIDLCGLVRLPLSVPDTDPYFTQVQAHIEYLRTVIDGVIDGSQYMLTTRYDPTGEVAEAGGIIAVFEKVWPVGSYYFSDNDTNPSETLGFGTWDRAAIGRMLVGVNENDTPFDAPGKTGGSQTHALAASALPSHRHTVPALSGTAASAGAHTHAGPSHTHSWSGTTSWEGDHAHGITSFWNASNQGTVSGNEYQDNKQHQATLWTQGAGGHSHTISGTTGGSGTGATGSSGAHTHTVSTTANNTGYFGSGSAVNHMNPFETAYIWKRVA